MKIRQLCIILLILFFPVLHANEINFNTLKDIFDCPFGKNPLLETSNFNGSSEIKLSYQTKVPFKLLKNYYKELLSTSNWAYVPIENIPININASNKNNSFHQLHFFNNKSILSMLYFKTNQPDNYLSFSLRDKMPSFALDINNTDFSHINNICFTQAEIVFNYQTSINNKPANYFLSFKTSASKESVLDYYNTKLLQNGWFKLPLFNSFQKELNDIQKYNDKISRFYDSSSLNEIMKNMIMYKNHQNKFLFFFINTLNNTTNFGYFLKTNTII